MAVAEAGATAATMAAARMAGELITVAKELIAVVKELIAVVRAAFAAKEVSEARVARAVLMERAIHAAQTQRLAAVQRKQIAPQTFIPPSTMANGILSATAAIPPIIP